MKQLQTKEIIDIYYANLGVQIVSDEIDLDINKQALKLYKDFEEDEIYPNLRRLLTYYCGNAEGPRYMFDGDAMYFYYNRGMLYGDEELALRGDILFSIWTPLIRFLNTLPGVDLSLRKDFNNVQKVLQVVTTVPSCEVLELFDQIAALYFTRGNILRLPGTTNREGRKNMNPDRFMKTATIQGEQKMMEDKIDMNLYECFAPGVLACYFSNVDERLCEWIRNEHLECMFSAELMKGDTDIYSKDIKDSQITRKNIQPLVFDSFPCAYSYSDFAGEEDFVRYLKSALKVIEYRNNHLYADKLDIA